VDCLFGFTGLPFDNSSGTYRTPARPYDPATGRWIEPDPTEFTAGDTNLYRYVGNSPANATDPTGLAPYEYHHIIAEWYAHYSSYGPREQGLRILLSQGFHSQLHNFIGQLWRAVRSGDMSQFAAYNRMLWAQVRMFPAMIRDSWRASAATGSSMFAWQGGVRAVAATLGYSTWGEAAMGATGVGVLVGGGITVGSLIHEHGELIAENQELNLQSELYDIWLKGGQEMGRRVARTVIKELTGLMDFSHSNSAQVEQAEKMYIDEVATMSGAAYVRLKMSGGARSSNDVPQLMLAIAQKYFGSLVKGLEAAGCRPKAAI
jgi:RHS repeat-associated protein